MNELIEALQIFAKYTSSKYPTHCEHDVLLVVDVRPEDISPDDLEKLEKLSFSWNDEYDAFGSYKFGSA